MECRKTIRPKLAQDGYNNQNPLGYHEPFVKVMTNSVILTEVTQHLSVRSLLQLTLASKLLRDSIRTYVLPQRLRLTLLGPESLRDRTLDSIPSLQWKAIALQVDGWKPTDIMTIISHMGNVTCLKLITPFYKYQKKSKLISIENLIDIVLAPHQLNSLTLSGGLMCRDLSTFFTSKINETIRNLTELKFEEQRHGTEEFYIMKYPNGRKGQRELLYSENFQKNMEHLLQMSPFPGLMSFATRGFHICPEYVSDAELKNLLINFIIAHKGTLAKLDVDSEVWTLKPHEISSGAIPMRKQRFPRLRSVSMDAGNMHSDSISEFVRIQPPVQNLVFDGSTYKATPPRGYNCGNGKGMFDTVSKMDVSRLITLDLKFLRKSFYPTRGSTAQRKVPLNWEFLQGARGLESFALTFVSKRGSRVLDQTGFRFANDISLILEYVPSGVQNITIGGVSEGKVKVDARNTLTNRMLSFLPQFSNLLTLDFFKSPNALNDSTLQAVLKHLPQLRTLGFSHCDRVTNFGITGIEKRGGLTGFGIKQLRDLQNLKIAECPKLTKALLTYFAFPGLVKLTLAFAPWYPNFLEEQAVVDLLLRNPCLEILRYNCSSLYAYDSEPKLPELLQQCGKDHVQLEKLHSPDYL